MKKILCIMVYALLCGCATSRINKELPDMKQSYSWEAVENTNLKIVEKDINSIESYIKQLRKIKGQIDQFLEDKK